MLTLPITYDQWMRETTVDGWFSEKKRSGLLLMVDQALKIFERSGPNTKLDALHALWTAYEAWYADKTQRNPAGPLNSIRNAGNQLNVFENWLRQQQTTWLPTVEPGWHNGPNCYAYAMKCKDPEGNGMTPGMAEGRGANLQGLGNDLVAYTHRLFDGIRRDAEKDGKRVGFYPPGVTTSLQRPSPEVMPRNVPRRMYLAAMLVTAGGFHFMRRDERTRTWSHKNGSFGVVEVSVGKIGPAGRLGQRHCAITDEVAVEMLRNAFPPTRYEALGGGYVFAGYLVVPEEGLRVKGTLQNFN